MTFFIGVRAWIAHGSFILGGASQKGGGVRPWRSMPHVVGHSCMLTSDWVLLGPVSARVP